MNKAELVREVAAQTGTTQKATEEMVTVLFDVIRDEMAKAGTVKVTGFGAFTGKEVEERTARNPQDGSELIVPAHIAPKFKASSVLKAAIR